MDLKSLLKSSGKQLLKRSIVVIFGIILCFLVACDKKSTVHDNCEIFLPIGDLEFVLNAISKPTEFLSLINENPQNETCWYLFGHPMPSGQSFISLCLNHNKDVSMGLFNTPIIH